ncbi:MAG: DNA polymerase III subunit gamma/tau [Elusimicrobiales bacterium]|nr:DNA polymerase III subunit gamma/tau [Elusimicrobiales bacterium]
MESLYLKYRPKSFKEIIGQEEIVITLSNAIKHKKIAHSYLFYGPRGCGKTSTARVLAKVLNCHNLNQIDPCSRCVSCVEISNSSSIDVVEIDAASHTQVQNIRDVIIDSVQLSPARDRYKIYILDEVHMLSTSAFNALLKTIEEPPSHVVFILATTEINKVPLTIISRCQNFRFKPLSDETIVRQLEKICDAENIRFESSALFQIAYSAQGAFRDAIVLLEKVSAFSNGYISLDKTREILGYPTNELIKKLSLAIVKRNISDVHFIFNEIKSQGYDVINVLKEVRDYFSKAFLVVNGLFNDEEYKIDCEMGNIFIFPKLSRKINKIIEEIKYSDNQNMLAEMFIYTLIDTFDIEEIIKKIENNTQPDIVGEYLGEKQNLSKEDTNVKVSNQQAWQNILNYFVNENYFVYNTLISSKIKFDGNKVTLFPSTEVEKEILLNNLNVISKIISNNGLEVVIEYNNERKNDVEFVKKEISQTNEIYFPEYERVKKVFGDSIVRVIENENPSKTN